MELNNIKFSISSPPDREFLVAEIFVGNEQIAEINRENNTYTLEIYPKKSGEWWGVNFEHFIKVLDEAKQELVNRYSYN